MTAQEIIDALAADPTSEAALTAVNDLVSQNDALTQQNQQLTIDLENSRKAYRERFLKGEDGNKGNSGGTDGNAVTIESLFKKN